MSEPLPPLPDDILEQINRLRAGFNEALGLVFTSIEYEEVRAELPIGPHLLQPYGLVHGGVYASIAESMASVGAAMTAMARGQTTVGLENHTSFIRAAREGKILASATPRTRGRRSQVWSVEMRDENGSLLSTSSVRMLCLEAGAQAGGEAVALKGGSIQP